MLTVMVMPVHVRRDLQAMGKTVQVKLDNDKNIKQTQMYLIYTVCQWSLNRPLIVAMNGTSSGSQNYRFVFKLTYSVLYYRYCKSDIKKTSKF